MNRFSVFLILLLAINTLLPAQKAQLSIYSAPESVQIRLDSVIIGSTPLENLQIEAGMHKLEALSPYGGLWNINNQVQTFRIFAGQDTVIRVRFQQAVQINSIPYRSRLLHNNQLIGFTPLQIPFEENRGKEFNLEKNGYRSMRFVLEKPEPLIFKLEPLEINPTEETNRSFASGLFRNRIKSKVFLLGGSVVAHWLAFYFKNVADDFNDKYRRTSDPERMNHYWDETQRYDRYSEISLGVSYAFLGGLIYTVFSQ